MLSSRQSQVDHSINSIFSSIRLPGESKETPRKAPRRQEENDSMEQHFIGSIIVASFFRFTSEDVKLLRGSSLEERRGEKGSLPPPPEKISSSYATFPFAV